MKSSGGIFDIPQKKEALANLEKSVSDPALWQNPDQAKKNLQQKKQLESALETFENLNQSVSDVETLFELSLEEKNQEAHAEVERDLEQVQAEFKRVELEQMLSAEQDFNDAIVTITPGAGGTESQDWALMLWRMYMRWAERRKLHVDVLDYQVGEGAGIKDVTLFIRGAYAFGYLKSEAGVHRLVRISPFDANQRRHTSFASVHVTPQIEEAVEMEINPADLRIDVYRASGPGGQGVNTTDSAVRITHVPTGLVVQCQSERSQHSNKDTAMKILRSRLYELKKQEEEKKRKSFEAEKKDIAWGSQIRSYVMHPYKLVKDHRTKYETSNVDEVMDGNVDRFMEAYLLASPKK